jgi:hypothetical protein
LKNLIDCLQGFAAWPGKIRNIASISSHLQLAETPPLQRWETRRICLRFS